MQQPSRLPTHQSARAGREGDVLAVVSQGGATVSFFDAASDRLLGTTDVLAEPHELCFDPTERLLWCTSAYRSGYYHANGGRRTEVTVIDPGTRRVVEVVDLAPEHGPHGLALDPARRRLYVSVEGSADRPGGVVVIDTATRRPVGRIDTGAPGPHWFAVDPAGRTGYATNKEAPFVSVVDLERGVMTAEIEVPGSEGLAVSADGGLVFVAAPYAGAFSGHGEERPAEGIRVIDTRTASVVDTLPAENVVMPVHVTSTGKLLAGEMRMEPDPVYLLGRQAPGRLSVFCADSRRRLGELETGLGPLTITSSPDGRIGYVACVVSSVVDVVDLETLERLARLDIAKSGEPGAHGLAYLPRPS
ncbi:YncE family protein [Streptomyces echinatus]|uniref:DNA-binding beta-propeller fold protein YncE n=1 Tax=Streptomyces echinatus TaxID=67293 RepID=A0A7W9UQY0_9ACTN|nr:YncE family protein [Streptomyces echinatus]MBB5926999.1 DNA-binding beta-propeller fold protein YncE [Streptomyces echinatus]